MKVKRSVLRFGDSLGVTLPADFSRDNKIRAGSTVFAVKNRNFIVLTSDRKVAEKFKSQVDEKASEARRRAEEAKEEVHEDEHAALMEAVVAEIQDEEEGK